MRQNWINKLAIGSLKANRARNVMVIISTAIISMVAATTLNTAVSLTVSAEHDLTDQIGTTAQCFISNPSAAQIRKLQSLPYIGNVGYEIDAGEAYYGNYKMKLEYISQDEWSENRKPTMTEFHGKMPEGLYQIALSSDLLHSLGMKRPYIGKEISFACSSKIGNAAVSDTVQRTFTIVGWYDEKRQYEIKDQGIIYISHKFAEAGGLTAADSGFAYFSFTKNPLMKELGIIKNVFDGPKVEEASQEDISKLKTTLRIGEDQQIKKVYRAPGYIYDTQSMEPYLVIVVPVVVCGFLLIFDCFYLTVFRDLRECGMLMAVGASLKQLNSMLWKQATVLGAIGIIFGLLLSIAASLFMMPLYVTSIVGKRTYFVWTFSSFFLSALITLAIVAVSSQAVNIYLGRVSIIESIRGGGGKNKKLIPLWLRKCFPIRKSKIKSSKNIYQLALNNVMRNTKSNWHVLLSLFIAATVFLLINVIISGMDPEQSADHQFGGNDFILVNKTFYGNYLGDNNQGGVCLKKSVFQRTFTEELKQQKGVEKVNSIGYLPVALKIDLKVLGAYNDDFCKRLGQTNFFSQGIYTLDDLWIVDTEYLLRLLDKTQKSRIDIKAFENGDTVFIDSDNPALFPENFVLSGSVLDPGMEDQLNQSNQIIVPDYLIGELNGKNGFTFQEGGFCSAQFHNGIAYTVLPPSMFVNYSAVKQFDRSPIIAEIDIDTDQAHRFGVEKYLKETVGGNPLISIESREQLIQNMVATKNAIYILGYLISMIVMLIGLLGFINMAVIKTQLRKGEFAVLRSIGMTQKQMTKMLILEGICDAGILILSVATIGNLLVYGIYELYFGGYKFPFIPLLFFSITVSVILSVIPLVVYSPERKKSISKTLQEI